MFIDIVGDNTENYEHFFDSKIHNKLFYYWIERIERDGFRPDLIDQIGYKLEMEENLKIDDIFSSEDEVFGEREVYLHFLGAVVEAMIAEMEV